MLPGRFGSESRTGANLDPSLMDTQFWRHRNVFVTGATGLLGSWLCERLLDFGANVVALVRDDLPNSHLHLSGAIGRVTVVGGELQDYLLMERVLGEYEIDTVFQDDPSTAAEVKRSLVNHDGYDPRIIVRRERDRHDLSDQIGPKCKACLSAETIRGQTNRINTYIRSGESDLVDMRVSPELYRVGGLFSELWNRWHLELRCWMRDPSTPAHSHYGTAP